MKRFAFACSFVLLSAATLRAGIEPTLSTTPQSGMLFFNSASAPISHAMSSFSTTTGLGSGFALKSVTNSVKLWSDQNSTTAIAFDYELKVPVRITYWKPGVGTAAPVQVIVNEILSINYFPDPTQAGKREYRQADAFAFRDGCQVEVKVNGAVTATKPSASNAALSPAELALVAQTVFVQSEITVERYYTFAPNTPLCPGDFTLTPIVTATANELEIKWNAIGGAEEYDLEWVFVDDYGTGTYPTFLSIASLPYDFDQNAARVQVKAPKYTIPLVYEQGWLLFRVRGIGRSAVDKFVAPVPGVWSCGSTTCPSGCNTARGFVGAYNPRFQVGNAAVFESDKMNWQAVTNYAEEGKRKTVVSFVDGSNRVRQTVTVMSSERMALVGEKIYDHQGRAAIEVLPAPVNDARLRFYPNFNQNQSGVPYSRKDFDLDLSNCKAPTGPMRSVSTAGQPNIGAANYYSPFNPAQTGFNAYIPDAENFPFTQTEFMPDNTGRIRQQSGVGKTHLLGDGHETQYFYGTPVQEELDRLLGNNMGNALHYKKNMVRDANGQHSITWLDPKGNTIATALGGEVPTNLDKLPSYQTVQFDVDLLATNVKDTSTYSLTDVRTLMVSTAGTYNFTYSMTGLQFHDATCMDALVCYDCIYDLELAVIDNLNCNDTLFHHARTIGKLMEPILVSGQPSGEYVVSAECETPAFGFNSKNDLPPPPPGKDAFGSIKLKVGSYTLVKRLKVNEAAADAYAHHFLDDPTNKCSQKWDEFWKTELSKIDTFGCHVGCGDIDPNALNDPSLTPAERAELQAQIEELKESVCDTTLTLCEVAYKAMLIDVSPGGQYGYIPGTSPVNAEDPAMSVFAGSMVLNGTVPPPAFYQNSGVVFKDENGNPFKILNTTGALVPINDASVRLDTFLNYWRDDWAVELVKFHPEYCYYDFCFNYLQAKTGTPGNFKTSESYDADLNETFEYSKAVQKGFIDLNNPTAIMDKDPFFSTAVFPAPPINVSPTAWQNMWKARMAFKIAKYVTVNGQSLSMKQMAMAIANCPGSPTTACANANWGTGKADAAWAAYRALYTSVKQGILYKTRSKYAVDQQCYNGCIGEDPFRWNLNSFSGSFWSFPFINNNKNYCDIYTFQFFKNKQKRFPSVYDALPPDFNLDFYNSDSTLVVNTIYELMSANKGSTCCNMEQHFPQFLMAILKKGNPPLNFNIQPGDPAYPADILDQLMQGKQQPLNVTVSVSGNKYSFHFTTLQPPVQHLCYLNFTVQKPVNTNIIDLCCYQIDPSNPGMFTMTVKFSDGTSKVIQGDGRECFLKCPVEEPECPITQDAKELGIVFSYLVANNKLVGNLLVPSNIVGPYLAGALGQQFDLGWQGTTTSGTLTGKIKDTNTGAVKCTFTLQIPTNVTIGPGSQVLGIRPDPSPSKLTANGHTLSFFLKIKLPNGSVVDIPGTNTCLSISFCCKFTTTKFEKPLWGINTQNDVMKNCRSCEPPMTITGGIFGSPVPWASSCFANCDTIKEYIYAYPDSCVQNLLNIAHYNADKQYGYYRDSLKAAVRDAYLKHCMGAAEAFRVIYAEVQHHYTLYYYDQANNLVKTVPPAGVVPLVVAQIQQVAARRRGANVSAVYPAHTLTSRYRYNSLNQLVWQKIPDHKFEAYFYYDGLGRLVASINGKQRITGGGYHFSYTRFDGLGRIVEVGQTKLPITAGSTYTTFLINLRVKARDYKNWDTYVTGGTRTEITRTLYDQPISGSTQKNLRGRVSSVTWMPDAATSTGPKTSQIVYSYDIHGNVATMVQYSFALDAKTVEYDYDLMSGKVNSLAYQRYKGDQFLHRYTYDADNRLTEVRTSPDGIFWDKDAAYQYYKHGPLARTELGDARVQGLDYAYTLHGWIKGVNSGSLRPNQDMGKDGNTLAQGFARDAFGYLLSYYSDDYKSIGTGTTNMNVPATAPNLFNGNIRQMTTAIEPFMLSTGQPLASDYAYDQLNRLLKATYNQPSFDKTSNQWISGAANKKWQNAFEYDANGNILKQKRNGDKVVSTATAYDMDDLTYAYYPGTNQLQKISDPVAPSNYTLAQDKIEDLETQTAVNNYLYDPIGNLTNDAAEKLAIQWNLQGKVSKITDSAPAQTIDFGYNPMGNRVLKTVNGESTYHALDATGNVLATYRRAANGNVVLESSWLFGSSRLGEYRAEKCVGGPCLPTNVPRTDHYYRFAGKRRYEESNHLGNVLATVSDRKVPVATGSVVTGFAADVVGAQDYYAFGMEMVGRTLASAAGRFGFNGQETTNEISGSGNSLSYEFRDYDPRIARFKSVDPLYTKYPMYTPYAFAANQPIHSGDIEGLENPNDKNSTVPTSSGGSKATSNNSFTTYQYSITQNVTENDYEYPTTSGPQLMSTTEYVPNNTTGSPQKIPSPVASTVATVNIISSNNTLQFDANVGILPSGNLGGHDASAQGNAYLTIDPNDPTRANLTVTTQVSVEEQTIGLGLGPVGVNPTTTGSGMGYVTQTFSLKITKSNSGEVELKISLQTTSTMFQNLNGVREYGPTWQNLWIPQLAPDVPTSDFKANATYNPRPLITTNSY